MFLICLHSLKTKPFVHVWGRKSRSSVIKNRKSFHLVHVLSSQWRLINEFFFKLWVTKLFILFTKTASFSNKLIMSEWNSLQLIIFKVKHTWNNFFARQEMKEIELLSKAKWYMCSVVYVKRVFGEINIFKNILDMLTFPKN
jgi:hypothetical protein